MSDNLEFLPPHQFSPLEDLGMLGGAGGGQIFTQGSGQPYDLIDDLPVSSGHTTTKARGGAVHFDNPPQTSTGTRSYPALDRAFFFTVDDNEVITQSFWGTPDSSPPYYFQTLVKSTEASIWGYADDGVCNFKALVDDDKSYLKLWKDDSPYKTIDINTDDFPSGTTDPSDLVVKLREIEICEKDDDGNPKKMLVLCSEPYKKS